MLERAENELEDIDEDGQGLMSGVGAFELRMLAENPWNGGAGYTPEQVGNMTLDQVMFRLVELDSLKGKVGMRTKTASPGSLLALADKDGYIKGRAADGTPMRARIRGKSLAREMMEKMEEKRLKELAKKRKSRKKR